MVVYNRWQDPTAEVHHTATLTGHVTSENTSISATFLAESRLILSGDSEGSIRAWKAASGELAFAIDAGEAPITKLHALQNGGFFVTVAESKLSDTLVAVWNTETRTLLDEQAVPCDQSPITLIGSPQPSHLAFFTSHCVLTIWNYANGQSARYSLPKFSCFQYTEGRSELIIARSTDFAIEIWDMAAGKRIQVMKGHTSEVSVVSNENSRERERGSDYQPLRFSGSSDSRRHA